MIYAISVQVFPQRSEDCDYLWSARFDSCRSCQRSGSGLIELTSGNADRAPWWSPDGKHIVYAGERFGGTNIIRMNADGTGQIA